MPAPDWKKPPDPPPGPPKGGIDPIEPTKLDGVFNWVYRSRPRRIGFFALIGALMGSAVGYLTGAARGETGERHQNGKRLARHPGFWGTGAGLGALYGFIEVPPGEWGLELRALIRPAP